MLVLLTEESSFVKLIRKPGRYCMGGGRGTGIDISVGSSISAREVVTSIGD